MTTRFNARSVSRFGVPGLPSGYDRTSVPEGLTIPSAGLVDADRGLFHLFDNEIPLTVTTRDGTQNVPIIFAGGEKWAMVKKGKPLRDRTGGLILPLITIMRNNIVQTPNNDIAGRGINQQTGELVIKRRLNKNDRAYQNLINRVLLRNQENVAVNKDGTAVDGQITVDRDIGDLTHDPTVQDGGLMVPDKMNNVYEFIIIPSPQFLTVTYQVTIWTQFIEQMNEVIEGLIASFLPQGNAWLLTSTKGYWYVATVDSNLYNAQNNFDDMSDQERLVKYQFEVQVPAYILASRTPGAPVPVRRYISAPSIKFETNVSPSIDSEKESVLDPFLGADDPTLPLDEKGNNRRDQRDTESTLLYPSQRRGAGSDEDPALTRPPRGYPGARYSKLTALDNNGDQVTRYARIKNVNEATGEIVYSSIDLTGLQIIVVED